MRQRQRALYNQFLTVMNFELVDVEYVKEGRHELPESIYR